MKIYIIIKNSLNFLFKLLGISSNNNSTSLVREFGSFVSSA